MEKNWIPADEIEELEGLKRLICSGIGGMDSFKKQRSHIMKIAYSCLRHTDRTFGDCQMLAWGAFDDLSCDEHSKEEL